MLNDVTRNKIPTKVMESIFQTGNCHKQEALKNLNTDCTGKHRANKYTQPKDQTHIEANRKKFMDHKKGQGRGCKNGKKCV
jgi:hypothetical protein